MNEHKFTIEDLCEVEIKLQSDKAIVESARVITSNQNVELLDFLPDGYKVKLWFAGCDPWAKEVAFNKIPDFESLAGLEEKNKFRKYLGFDWLITSLHEIGHAHKQYNYKRNWQSSRGRASTMNSASYLEDMTDTLNDEMGAWGFALNFLDSIGIKEEDRINACQRITYGYLGGYVRSALGSMKIQGIQGIKYNRRKFRLM